MIILIIVFIYCSLLGVAVLLKSNFVYIFKFTMLTLEINLLCKETAFVLVLTASLAGLKLCDFCLLFLSLYCGYCNEHTFGIFLDIFKVSNQFFYTGFPHILA